MYKLARYRYLPEIFYKGFDFVWQVKDLLLALWTHDHGIFKIIGDFCSCSTEMDIDCEYIFEIQGEKAGKSAP